MAVLTINPDGTAFLEVLALSGDEGATFINDATVEGRLQSLAGVDLTGQSWPLELEYVAASNGNYRGRIEADVIYPAMGKSVIANVTVTSGSDSRNTKDMVKVAQATGAA